MPRILVVGRTGQVGTALEAALPATGWPFVVMEAPALDLTDAQSIEAAVAAARPDVVVNAAAYTAVDAAESQVELAYAINARPRTAGGGGGAGGCGNPAFLDRLCVRRHTRTLARG